MSELPLIIKTAANKVLRARREYETWICSNPGKATDFESILKALSYLSHGQLKHSNILPELLYCSSRLLGHWHNVLIAKHQNVQIIANHEDRKESPRVRSIIRIQNALTIIEYFEVLLEVSARALWGELGRWIMILVIQSVKTGLRAALLLYYKVGVIPGASFASHQRPKVQTQVNGVSQPNMVFVLKHSGRVVRKIQAAPPISMRNWKLPDLPRLAVFPTDVPSVRFVAELLHVMRPLSHLAGMAVWGSKSWKPWLISLALDITSLQMHKQWTQKLRPEQKQELSRRTFTLLYYLIRSPFYDKFTKHRIIGSLVVMSSKIPLVGRLCAMLADSLPEWQETYSYIWNDF